MKKLTSVLLSVVMLMSVLCMPTQAVDADDCLKAVASYDTQTGTVTLQFIANQVTTNGKFIVNFNSDHLAYSSAEVEGVVVEVVEKASSLAVGYASTTSEAINTGRTVAVIYFSSIGTWTSTNIQVTVTQFNADEELNVVLPTITLRDSGESDPIPDPTPDPNPDPDPDPDPTIPIPQPPVGGDDPDVPVTPGGPGGGDEDEDKPGTDTPELTREEYEAILIKYPDIRGHWAEESIVKAIYAGLFKGKTENTFDPEGVVTRGMFVTLLYRLSGEPAVSGGMPFTDVPLTQYYADAVKWAYENNIVTGVTATEFKPDLEVTREQMVTMLYRYARFIGDDVSASVSLSGFGDADKVNGFAVEAMKWAVAEGLINGSNGNLNPGDASTRAQIATVLVRYAGL